MICIVELKGSCSSSEFASASALLISMVLIQVEQQPATQPLRTQLLFVLCFLVGRPYKWISTGAAEAADCTDSSCHSDMSRTTIPNSRSYQQLIGADSDQPCNAARDGCLGRLVCFPWCFFHSSITSAFASSSRKTTIHGYISLWWSAIVSCMVCSRSMLTRVRDASASLFCGGVCPVLAIAIATHFDNKQIHIGFSWWTTRRNKHVLNDTPHIYQIIDIDMRRPVSTGHDDDQKEGFDPTISSILSCSDTVRCYIRMEGSSDNAFDRVEKNIPQNEQSANCIEHEMLTIRIESVYCEMLTIRIRSVYSSVNLPHC